MHFQSRLLAKGRKHSSMGFSLIEVVLVFALLTSAVLSLLFTAMGAVRLNRLTELEVAGSNVINGQLNTLLAIARDNRQLAGGIAKGALYYMQELENKLPSQPYPVWVKLEGNVLYYEFAIPEPGKSLPGLVTVGGSYLRSSDDSLRDNTYGLARGVMEFYLNEKNVPNQFLTWSDINASGSGEVYTEVVRTFYDMDADNKDTGDFSDLMGASSAKYAASKLASLPVVVRLRYYRNVDDLEAEKDSSRPGFISGVDSSIISFSRSYVINDSGILGVG